MKILSKATVYGLRALIYMVSKQSETDYISIGEISEKLNISFHFLTKTFQLLSKSGILKSARGPSGGVAFTIPPEQIYIIDIVNVIESEGFFNTCLLGLPACGEEAPCPLHEFWKESKLTLRHKFETTSLLVLGEMVRDGRIRLSS